MHITDLSIEGNKFWLSWKPDKGESFNHCLEVFKDATQGSGRMWCDVRKQWQFPKDDISVIALRRVFPNVDRVIADVRSQMDLFAAQGKTSNHCNGGADANPTLG